MLRMVAAASLLLMLSVAETALSPAHAEEKVDVQKSGPKTMTSPAVEQPFTLEAELGLGYDSNAYLAPGQSYIDYAQTGNPTIDPVRHSGFFIPVLFRSEEHTSELQS